MAKLIILIFFFYLSIYFFTIISFFVYTFQANFILFNLFNFFFFSLFFAKFLPESMPCQNLFNFLFHTKFVSINLQNNFFYCLNCWGDDSIKDLLYTTRPLNIFPWYGFHFVLGMQFACGCHHHPKCML